MNYENLKKLKKLYDGKPDVARGAEESALEELKDIESNGINPKNQARANYLLDLVEYCRMPVGEPAGLEQPTTGGGGRNFRTMSEDEKIFRLGVYFQKVAASALEPGRRLGGEIPTGVISHELYAEETRSTGLEAATPSLGGFLISSDMSSELFLKAHDRSTLFQRCKEYRISRNASSIKIPAIDESSRVSGSRWGGITTYWLEEGGTKTASKPKFAAMEMSLKKLIGLCYATDELLEDASLLGQIIVDGFSEEFSFRLDDAILRGTGAGQPLGVLNAGCLVSVTGASSANTIVALDVAEMYRRLWPACEARAEWFGNRNILTQLMSMHSKQLTAAAAGDMLWQPANTMAGRPYQTLLGKPLHFIEQASDLGDAGDLMLADFSQYGVATKGGLQQATSIHVAYVTDEVCFRFVLRIDGQPLWGTAVTPYKGTDVLGPFIALNTRT